MRVLFLTPWYPSKRDAMSGLFVQKHVEAVRAQGVDVRVIHSEGWKDTWQQWRALQCAGWMPNVVQLNVIQKQGVLALWLKKRYNIPFVIVEHWSGYLPENGSFMKRSPIVRRLYAYIAEQAETILCVSKRHADAMRACGIRNAHWGQIHNVVDDFFFEPATHQWQKNKITLLHISCFDERAKNVKGLLRAAERVAAKRQDWQLVLAGTGQDFCEVRAYADTLNFPSGMIHWTGELTPRQVSEEFDKADVFILPSNYENAPVVISESLVKRVPIISSYVGGIPEMVSSDCGILTPRGDDEALQNAIEYMLDHYREYKTNMLHIEREQYSFTAVGTRLKRIYQSCQ